MNQLDYQLSQHPGPFQHNLSYPPSQQVTPALQSFESAQSQYRAQGHHDNGQHVPQQPTLGHLAGESWHPRLCAYFDLT
jgi:hypothetical protein